MFVGLGCCSARLKESAYRSDGGLGSFPFVKCGSSEFERPVSAITVGSTGSNLIYIDGALVVFLNRVDVTADIAHDGFTSQILDLSTKVAKLYPFIDYIEKEDGLSDAFILGHTGIQCSLMRVSMNSMVVPAEVACIVSTFSIIDEVDSFSCANHLRNSKLLLCGTKSGTVHVVSTCDGPDLGKCLYSMEPLFSSKNACISDITNDSRFVYISTDEVPEIIVYRIPEISKDPLTESMRINLSVPNHIVPLYIKSVLRPFSTHISNGSSNPDQPPSGALYFRTDRAIARYSFDSSSVVSYETFDAKQLFLGPFDNGPIMSVDVEDDRISCWESVRGRLVRSSEVTVKGVVQVLVSPNRQKPCLFVVTKNFLGKYFLETWGLRGVNN